jgi:hypothetical protein
MIITYMYWNYPTLEYIWPAESDPIEDSLHNGVHCLYYNPAVDKNSIRVNQRLHDLCHWANTNIKIQGPTRFLQDPANQYDIANLVKLNLWVHDLPITGSVKPMLLQYAGGDLYQSGTGESRLRALERVPQITTVGAFISTHQQFAQRFAHLESITTFDRFAEICQAVDRQIFLFRTTDAQAPYGLDWYEYNSARTESVTPDQEYCVEVMTRYLQQNLNVIFSPEWFDNKINWSDYENL